MWWILSGIFGGGMCGLFLLGMISRSTRNPAAVAVAGNAVILWLSIPKVVEGWDSLVHAFMIPVFGTGVILVAGIAITSILQSRSRNESCYSSSASAPGSTSASPSSSASPTPPSSNRPLSQESPPEPGPTPSFSRPRITFPPGSANSSITSAILFPNSLSLSCSTIGKYASRHIKATKSALSILGICSDFMAEPFHKFNAPERVRVEAIIKELNLPQLQP